MERDDPRHFSTLMGNNYPLITYEGTTLYSTCFDVWRTIFESKGIDPSCFYIVSFGWFAPMDHNGGFDRALIQVDNKIKEGKTPNMLFCANSLVEYDNMLRNHPLLVNNIIFTPEHVRACMVYDYSFDVLDDMPKKYDALLTANYVPYKNRHLAGLVRNIAAVAPSYRNPDPDLPYRAYQNETLLAHDELVPLYNQCRCGMALSTLEGSNRATLEYLLCGLPVVSIPEKGGRSVSLTAYNSIIVPIDFQNMKSLQNKQLIADAVGEIVSRDTDPHQIRRELLQMIKGGIRRLFNRAFTLIGGKLQDPSFYFKFLSKISPALMASTENAGTTRSFNDQSYTNIQLMSPKKTPKGLGPAIRSTPSSPSHKKCVFVTLTDDEYLPGALAVCHSVRRWYPDNTIYVWHRLENPDNLAELTRFAEDKPIVLKPVPPRLRDTHMWNVKPFIINATPSDSFIYIDSDALLTYKISSVLDVIDEGFIWGVRTPAAMISFMPSLEDKVRVIDPDLTLEKHKGITGGFIGWDKSRYESLGPAWCAEDASLERVKGVYGDTGSLNWTITKERLWPRVHYYDDSLLYGALWSDAKDTRFEGGLFLKTSPHCKGITHILHYNGEKPWTAVERGGWNPEKITAGRGSNPASLDVWRSVHDSVLRGDPVWLV